MNVRRVLASPWLAWLVAALVVAVVTVRLMPGTVPDGRLYFCHHFTRDLVWRDEWRHHAHL